MKRRKERYRSTDPNSGETFEIEISEPLHEFLERSVAPDDEWLWCIFCERFFQARHLRIDFQAHREGCAFCACAGFDCAIFKWDTFRDDDPSWPSSVSQLRHGLPLRQVRA